MKGGRRSRATGGENEAEEDLKDKPPKRSNTGTSATDSGSEAEERKHGGRAKRRHGGKTEVGKIEGEKAKMHAGRKPRKSGGRTGSDSSPFTSAKQGKDAPGRKVMEENVGDKG
jgi:hypothetical protein